MNLLITYKSCGIIGYGKIGRGIAEYLQQRGVKPFVSEIKAIRSVQASCDGAILSSTEDLIKNSDVIFCATGSRALDLVKLRGVKKGAFIASATSSDDEFNLDSVDDEYKRQIIDETITLYTKRGHSFHLLNEGNAINFLFSAAVDKYIYLVQGELIFSLGQLAKKVGGGNTHDTILTNIAEDHESIARSWLDYLVRNDQPN